MHCPKSIPTRSTVQRGFTLAEVVIVIVITGIIAAVVAVFIRKPVEGYIDAARRAEMTDTADTAARRIARDLRLALPNSVRVNGAGTAVEFLLTRIGGRYRAEKGAASDDPLDFSGIDSSFDILGAPITFQEGEQIAIYNLGIPDADAYAGDNLRTYNSTGSTPGNVKFTPGTPFPFDSPGHRFQVMEGPVTYRCAGGELRRFAGYAISAAQPDPPGGASALLANNVSGCLFTYDAVNQRFGLLSIRLTLAQSGETVGLHYEVHVNNVP